MCLTVVVAVSLLDLGNILLTAAHPHAQILVRNPGKYFTLLCRSFFAV